MKLPSNPANKMRARLALFLLATVFSVPALYAQGGGGHQGGGHQGGGARQHTISSGSSAARVREQQSVQGDEEKIREQQQVKQQQVKQQQERVQAHDRIYGEHLMSEQERNQYRKRINDAGSEKERERIRAEHHKMITQRAAERGVKVED
jgi:hypothetical protein